MKLKGTGLTCCAAVGSVLLAALGSVADTQTGLFLWRAGKDRSCLWLPCGKDATVHQHGSHGVLFPGPIGRADVSVVFILNPLFS